MLVKNAELPADWADIGTFTHLMRLGVFLGVVSFVCTTITYFADDPSFWQHDSRVVGLYEIDPAAGKHRQDAAFER